MNRASLSLLGLLPIMALSDERFKTLDETRIYDGATQLVWEKAGAQEKVTYAEAEFYCKALSNKSGYNWRLPKVKELATLVDENRYRPSIYPVFQTQSRMYWSSTLNAADDKFVWLVNFSDSHIHSFLKKTQYYVRCTYSSFK